MGKNWLFYKMLIIAVLAIGGLCAPATVLAGTTQPGADFKILNLVIPAEVIAGEKFTISATVTNSASNDGNYEATLNINGVKEATSITNVPPKGERIISFSLTKTEPGIYEVDLDGLTGSFTVTSKPLAPAKASTSSIGLIIGIAAAALVILVVAFWVISRKRAHSKTATG